MEGEIKPEKILSINQLSILLKNRFALQNKYYLKTDKGKRDFTNKVFLFITSAVLIALFLAFYFKIYFFAPIFIWTLLSILAPFIDTPILVKKGKLNYYSKLLLAENENNNVMVIHGGTLFDYYFTLDKNASSRQRKIIILQQYLEGLLQIIVERKGQNLQIKATTYILNERTGKKIGFNCRKPDFIQTLILIINYPNLLVTKSFANNVLSFPNLRKTRTFETDINSLIKNQSTIEKLNTRLKETINKKL